MLIALLVLALILVPVVAACGGEEEAVPPGGADAAKAADAAVAAVTKSGAIETPKTVKAGFLQAGSDTAFPPMEFPNKANNGYIGFDVDLCTALAMKMGLKLEVVSTAWDGIIPALLANRYDIIMSGMSILPERLEQMNATDAYLPGIIAISTPKDKPINDAAGLTGKIVGVQVDTTGQFEVEKVEGVKEIKKYPTIGDAFLDMAAGRVEAVVNDEPVNAYIIATNADYAKKFVNSGGIMTDNSYAYWCTKENTALQTAMNTALKELRAEGVYTKILAKWALTGN